GNWLCRVDCAWGCTWRVSVARHTSFLPCAARCLVAGEAACSDLACCPFDASAGRYAYHCIVRAQSYLRAAALEYSLPHLPARCNASHSRDTMERKPARLFAFPTFYQVFRHTHQARAHCLDLTFVACLYGHALPGCSSRNLV